MFQRWMVLVKVWERSWSQNHKVHSRLIHETQRDYRDSNKVTISSKPLPKFICCLKLSTDREQTPDTGVKVLHCLPNYPPQQPLCDLSAVFSIQCFIHSKKTLPAIIIWPAAVSRTSVRERGVFCTNQSDPNCCDCMCDCPS